MPSCRGVVVLIALLLTHVIAEAPPPPHVDVAPPLLPASVSQWSVSDVERWMNYTVGYAEYVPTIRLHAVDGPTLLYLTHREVEDHFNVANSIHLAKIRGHLQLLRAGCACPLRQLGSEKDFWSALKEHNRRTWVFGLTALFMPRVALLGAYLWDSELWATLFADAHTAVSDELLTLTGSDADEGRDGAAAHSGAPWTFLLMSVFCPSVLLLVKAAYFFDVNYVLVVAVLVHFSIAEYNELGIFYLAYKRKLVGPGETRLSALKAVLGFAPLVPVVAVVTSYFVPYLVQQLAVGVFVAYVTMCALGLLAVTLKHFTSSEADGDQPPHPEKKD
jgi:hypothetical protein